MSWLDEAIARRLREQRNSAPQTTESDAQACSPQERQQQEVAAFDPLLQRLLTEYGEHAFGKSLLQKRFLVRLERPGEIPETSSGKRHMPHKMWTWHWHLDSLIPGKQGVELHPVFTPDGVIQSFVLLCGEHRVEISSPDEDAIKEGLVSLYLK